MDKIEADNLRAFEERVDRSLGVSVEEQPFGAGGDSLEFLGCPRFEDAG